MTAENCLGERGRGGPSGAKAIAAPPRSRELRIREIVDANWALIARMLRHLGLRDADIDDGVQQVFVVFATKFDQVRLGCERAFLVQSAIRIAARARRAHGRSREQISEFPVDVADPAEGADLGLDRARARAQLTQIFACMPLDLRAVFVLYEIEEMTMADMAQALEIPPGTVASRLRRARQLFQQEVRLVRDGRGDLPSLVGGG